MVHRAADYQMAKEVCVAVDLARAGAPSALIERVTGFGKRWVRSIVREHGGAPSTKAKDVGRWLDQEPDRLIQAQYALRLFEQCPLNASMGSRIFAAYKSYRNVPPDPVLLGITEFAQIVDLFQSRKVWARACTDCEHVYLVHTERSLCPNCRTIDSFVCRGCQQPLPAHLSSRRQYCDECSPRAVRKATLDRTRHIEVQVRVEERRGVTTQEALTRNAADKGGICEAS